ncbi:hypothetical protein PM082_023884 [Marasmius tenuissimus]|nr:hypothetical protein PM082_023884 [Marasmius tenuissimus]
MTRPKFCPFCPARIKDENAFTHHIRGHECSEPIMKMSINRQGYLLERVNGFENIYECPECNIRGRAWAVYIHFYEC